MKNLTITILVVIVIILIGCIGYINTAKSNTNKEQPVQTTITQEEIPSADENATGIITSAYTKNGKNYIDIDYITLRHESGDMPWGSIVNINPRIRTFEVSTDVYIHLQNREVNGILSTGSYVIDFPEFKQIFVTKDDFRKSGLWNIAIKNGVVVRIEENFRS